MCVVIPAAVVAWAAVAGAGLAAYGAYTASETRKDTAEYQSQVAANNRTVAEWQAADSKERGDRAAADARRKYAAVQGTQTASLAARGLDISEGSAGAMLADTEFFGAYDQNIIRSNAAREAWGYQVKASNFAGDSAAYSASAAAENPLLSGALAGAQSYFGSAAARSGAGGGSIGGTNSLLNNGTQVAPYWYGSGSPSISNRG